MPIGIGAAVGIGTAVIGAGGAYLSAKSQQKAIKNANETTQENNAANIAFMKEQYGQNKAQLEPWAWGGMEAGNALMGMLLPGYKPKSLPGMPASGALGGGGGGAAPGGTPGGTGGSTTSEGQWALGAIAAMAPNITTTKVWQTANGILDPVARLNYLMSLSPPSSDQYPLYQQYVASNPRPTSGAPAPTPTPTPTPTPAPGGALGGPQRVNSETAFNALPSGTPFVAPDGTQRIKP